MLLKRNFVKGNYDKKRMDIAAPFGIDKRGNSEYNQR